ncbi:MAG: glycosyltransferase [Hyphomicrobiales bacterium]
MGKGETVSACLIVKNEQGNLPDCLAFLDSKVDEIVIVDTGSTDSTIDIAERAGAKVIHDPWDQDFSTPRNIGLDNATSDWILYIDADERLVLPSTGRLGSLLPGRDASAARILLQPSINSTVYTELRLFRNDPRIRFQGIMHERVKESLREVCRVDGTRVANVHGAKLDHVGYEGDQSHKHARNEPILRKALKQDPTRVYCWFHLGVTLRAIGKDNEADECLKEAYDRAVNSKDIEELSVASSCCQIRSAMFLERGDAEKALQFAEQGLILNPENYSLIWSKGRAHLALGQAKETIDTVSSLTQIDSDTLIHETLAFDRTLFGRDTYGLLGSANFELGHYSDAAAFFHKAELLSEEPLEFKSKRLLCETLDG